MLVVNPVQQAYVRDALNVPANSRRRAARTRRGLARQIAEREFDHCREDSRWQLCGLDARLW